MAENLYIPEISGPLRSFMLKVPEEIQQASGIRVMGKLIKSIVFTTDKIGKFIIAEKSSTVDGSILPQTGGTNNMYYIIIAYYVL